MYVHSRYTLSRVSGSLPAKRAVPGETLQQNKRDSATRRDEKKQHLIGIYYLKTTLFISNSTNVFCHFDDGRKCKQVEGIRPNYPPNTFFDTSPWKAWCGVGTSDRRKRQVCTPNREFDDAPILTRNTEPDVTWGPTRQ